MLAWDDAGADRLSSLSSKRDITVVRCGTPQSILEHLLAAIAEPRRRAPGVRTSIECLDVPRQLRVAMSQPLLAAGDVRPDTR